MKKALLIVAATAGAIAGLAVAKRRGGTNANEVSQTASVWADAVSTAADKAAGSVADAAQDAAAVADKAAQRVSDAAATVGAVAADAADRTGGAAGNMAKSAFIQLQIAFGSPPRLTASSK